jgi:hypothetical protein
VINQEEWRPIPGQPGYEVSSAGRVLSRKYSKPRLMRTSTDPAGYPTVQLCQNNAPVKYRVHRLVAEAFYGPRPIGAEVRHLNGVKSDNRSENLRWGSQSENSFDRVRHGTHHWAKQTHCVNGHEFTPENTYHRPSRPRARDCRACHNAHSRARYERRMFAAANVPLESAA